MPNGTVAPVPTPRGSRWRRLRRRELWKSDLVSEPLPLRFVADLTEGLDGRVLAVSASSDGHGLALVVSHEDWKRATGRVEDAGGASFATTRVEPPYPAVFVEHDGRDVLRNVELDAVPLAFPSVQTLPGGEILVVGGRCWRHDDGTAEHNAHVYDERGSLQRAFTLGDGIGHVQTTSAGAIWVGYFDEGVFGNFGWNDPIGSPGIVVFDAAGRVTWHFEPGGGISDISDCYALNVADRETWSCYYTDFPVVRIADRELTSWSSDAAGVGALAVHRDRLLLVGGYSSPDRVVLAGLADGPPADPLNGRVEQLSEFVLRASDGAPLREATVLGRGGTLHVFNGPDWYRVAVAEV
jgi:hypothetical protein